MSSDLTLEMNLRFIKPSHNFYNHVMGYLKRGVDIRTLDRPDHYVIGSGHLKFFYDKIEYLVKRQADLYIEAKKRRARAQPPTQPFGEWAVPSYLLNDWEPTEADMEVCRLDMAYMDTRGGRKAAELRRLKQVKDVAE